jgi:hypothetical protein
MSHLDPKKQRGADSPLRIKANPWPDFKEKQEGTEETEEHLSALCDLCLL